MFLSICRITRSTYSDCFFLSVCRITSLHYFVDKLRSDGRANKQLIYSESASSMEKLAVLRAWAEVYIEAINRERSKPTPPGSESLLDLVRPELRSLARLWLAILRDYALLSLSPG